MNPPSLSGIPLRMKIGPPGRAGCPQPAARGAVRTPRPTHFRGNLASAERGSVSRSNLGSGRALRLTEPRSVRVAGFRGARREVLVRGILPPREEREFAFFARGGSVKMRPAAFVIQGARGRVPSQTPSRRQRSQARAPASWSAAALRRGPLAADRFRVGDSPDPPSGLAPGARG